MARTTPIADFLLERHLALEERLDAQADALAALSGYLSNLATLTERLGSQLAHIDVDGARTKAELDTLRLAAIASVGELQRLSAGDIASVDLMVRDGDGNVQAVVHRAPPSDDANVDH